MTIEIFDRTGGLSQTRKYRDRVRAVGFAMALGLSAISIVVVTGLSRNSVARTEHIARTFSDMGIVTYASDGLLSGDPDMMASGRHELVALDLAGFATSAGVVEDGPACAERAMILARPGEIWAFLPEAQASEVWAIPEFQNS